MLPSPPQPPPPRVTASTFGVICEVDAYATARSLWELKTNRLDFPEEEEEEENEHTARGIAHESDALEAYSKAMQVSVQRPTYFENASGLGALSDGLVVKSEVRRLVEVKCPARGLHDAIPLTYMCQIQGQMEICNEEYCDFASWHVEAGIRIWRVKRSNAFWEWMLPQLLRFQTCLLEDVPPPNRSANQAKSSVDAAFGSVCIQDLGVFKFFN